MFWKKLFGKATAPGKSGDKQKTQEGSIKAVVLSDVGNSRVNNEDAALFLHNTGKADEAEEFLLIVADGMGGHQAGEVASNLAVDVISKEYCKTAGNGSVEKKLAKAFAIANEQIFQKACSDKQLQGMGTTCTALVVTGNTVYYAHAGDSRAYLLKNGALTRITEDHTYVQELLKKGEITAWEAANHPNRNILTNAMGTNPQLRVDTGKCTLFLEDTDRLLLCTDGLYDYLNDQELAETLGSDRPVQEIAERLIAEAKKRGGHDNITVVLAEWTDKKKKPQPKETEDVALPITQEHDLL